MRELRFYGKDRASRETWEQIISQMIPFNAGAMRGRVVNQGAWVDNTGQLPPEYAKEIREGNPEYIVFSYETPIMWHDAVTGKWRFPRVKYSATTSSHQQHAEYAIKIWDGEKWRTPDNFDDSGIPDEVPCSGPYL